MKTTFHAFLACLVFIVPFSIYLYTMVPGLTGDDSGELAGVAATLGTAHPPGYPLYSLAGKAVVSLVPWGNPAYRVNLVSALFIAASCVIMFLICLEITCSAAASFALGLIFAFSGLVWAMANVTEVYGIAAFLVCLMTLVIVRSKPDTGILPFFLVSYIYGIGFNAHYTLGLLLPGLLWWAFYRARNSSGISWKRYLFGGMLFFFAGLSLMLFLYVRGRALPVFGWEDPSTSGRFWQVIARLRYGTISLAQGGAPEFGFSMILAKLLFFGRTTADNFTSIGTLLLAGGVFYALRDKLKGWTLILFLLGTGPGFLIMANANLGPNASALLKRFFFLPFIFAAALMALPLSKLPAYVSMSALILPVFFVARNFPELNHRQEYFFFDSAKNMLNTLPPEALLFSDRADEMEFAVAYLHSARGMRPDITFVDCNAGITKSIYGNDYYRIWGPPRLAIRERVEKDIISRSRHPVYYASFEPGLFGMNRRQEGLLFLAGGPLRPYIPFGELYAYRTPRSIDSLDERGRNNILSYFSLMGQYYLANGDPAGAEYYFNGISAYDSSRNWAANIAYQYHSKGFTDHARKYYEKSIASGHASADAYTNLGAIYESKGELAAAEKLYNEALSKDPESVQAHYNLSVLYWKQNRWADVVRELETVLKLNPRHADARRFIEAAKGRMK